MKQRQIRNLARLLRLNRKQEATNLYAELCHRVSFSYGIEVWYAANELARKEQ